MICLEPGLREGELRLPPSKSHAHRVLIADFLAGGSAYREVNPLDCDDIVATKRCLSALAFCTGRAPTPGPFCTGRAPTPGPFCTGRALTPGIAPVFLPVGESGTTQRLLGPIVVALGLKPVWQMEGRLATRPQRAYAELKPGVYTLPGDVSSQFVSGLLFALPLLEDESQIRLSSPLSSRGYVEMTLEVLKAYGICIEEGKTGFRVPAGRYVRPTDTVQIESDWSSAAFLFALNALGNEIAFSREGLSETSHQPDRVVREILEKMPFLPSVDVDACPDLFPVLTVVAAAQQKETSFTGIRRLRLKESDRVAAMKDVLTRLGVRVDVTDESFVVHGTKNPFKGGSFTSYADHRIALSIAVGATHAAAPVTIDNVSCASKSYPTFFADFSALIFRTGRTPRPAW